MTQVPGCTPPPHTHTVARAAFCFSVWSIPSWRARDHHGCVCVQLGVAGASGGGRWRHSPAVWLRGRRVSGVPFSCLSNDVVQVLQPGWRGCGCGAVNGWSIDFLGLLHVVGYLPHIGVYGWGPCGVLFVSCLLVHLFCARGIMMTLPTSSLLQVLRVP